MGCNDLPENNAVCESILAPLQGAMPFCFPGVAFADSLDPRLLTVSPFGLKTWTVLFYFGVAGISSAIAMVAPVRALVACARRVRSSVSIVSVALW